MLIRPFFLFLLPLSILFSGEFCYFIPPKDWQCSKPKTLSPYVQVGFVTKGKNGFCPSISLAIEEIDGSLKEYVKDVKAVHLSEGTPCRDLGKFSMKGGIGHLLEISDSSSWGPVKMLQAFLVHNKKAYILTAAVLQEEFLSYQKEMLQSLKTLCLIEDPSDALANEAERETLKQFFRKLGSSLSEEEQRQQWEELQKVVANCGDFPGAHWQFLVLKEGYAKIYSSSKSSEK